MRRPLTVLVAMVALTLAAPSAMADPPPRPLGIPVPERVAPGDVLATSTESGDIQGPPGVALCESAPHQSVSLPADDGPHSSSTYLEWWWWYGIVTGTDGRRFGIVLLAETKPSAQLQGFDYAITDLDDGTFHYGREPHVAGEPAVDERGFQMAGQGASIRGAHGTFDIRIEVDEYAVDLSLRPVKPAALAFGDGHTNAMCNNVYLYSRPAMRAAGTVSHADRTSRVRGVMTLDHMWGFDPAVEWMGWDWWTLHLDDGRDVELIEAQFVKNDDRISARFGYVAKPDGAVASLHPADFTVTPTRYSRRDATCSYPVGFDATVLGETFHIEAMLDTTEVRALGAPEAHVLWSGWPLYWDGPAVVTGAATGEGWMDLGHHCAA